MSSLVLSCLVLSYSVPPPDTGCRESPRGASQCLPCHSDSKKLHAADTTSTSYLSFMFAKPVEDASKAVTGLNFTEGKLVGEVCRGGALPLGI